MQKIGPSFFMYLWLLERTRLSAAGTRITRREVLLGYTPHQCGYVHQFMTEILYYLSYLHVQFYLLLTVQLEVSHVSNVKSSYSSTLKRVPDTQTHSQSRCEELRHILGNHEIQRRVHLLLVRNENTFLIDPWERPLR